jgi:hypothetical protein
MRTSMLITAPQTSVDSRPFSMGGLHVLCAGQPWERLKILPPTAEPMKAEPMKAEPMKAGPRKAGPRKAGTRDGLVGKGGALGHAAVASTKGHDKQ